MAARLKKRCLTSLDDWDIQIKITRSLRVVKPSGLVLCSASPEDISNWGAEEASRTPAPSPPLPINQDVAT